MINFWVFEPYYHFTCKKIFSCLKLCRRYNTKSCKICCKNNLMRLLYIDSILTKILNRQKIINRKKPVGLRISNQCRIIAGWLGWVYRDEQNMWLQQDKKLFRCYQKICNFVKCLIKIQKIFEAIYCKWRQKKEKEEISFKSELWTTNVTKDRSRN